MGVDGKPVTSGGAARIQSAEVVLPCSELDATLDFFVERLGFRLDAIHPADDPRVATLSGYGLRLRLERHMGADAKQEAMAAPGVLRLTCEDPAVIAGGASELVAPNGTRLLLVGAFAREPVVLPPLEPSFVVARLRDAPFISGRAGMRYRDLIPGRQGGRFIASHIVVEPGGPVPDYVHFHAIAFQMIFCAKGWVRVVYEDQGPPFVLRAGDCALQPPRIRHRVLECSPGLEVIEVSAPAEHETFADHELTLPTPHARPERDFGGQRFVRHDATTATWLPWQTRARAVAGFEMRDLGIGEATSGIAGASVVRTRDGGSAGLSEHDGDLLFAYVLTGDAALEVPGRGATPHPLAEGDAFCVPRGQSHALMGCSAGFEMLQVWAPAR